ncbi:MAG: hypothetical protein EAZ27_14055 [Cytophagales bacterium]|nr:MAG: hypothetical protein EAZ27_14055 [Cytophagales bacterium]
MILKRQHYHFKSDEFLNTMCTMRDFCISTFILFIIINNCVAQRGYWGTTINLNETARQSTGKLFRTDSIGSNLTVMHRFSDTLLGKHPNNSLLLASNGKIYGTSIIGGTGGQGTLFEYDLSIDSFKVLVNFGQGVGQFPYGRPHDALIETSPGVLYGVSFNTIFKYIISTNVISHCAAAPSFQSGFRTIQNEISGGLYKASNGLMYGTTLGYSACPFSDPGVGSVFRFNPSNNSFSYIFPFSCSLYNGASPNGNFVEHNGKFYSTTKYGGKDVSSTNPGKGVIFEYNPIANTYTKKFDFNDTLGLWPTQQSLVKANNGRFYGLSSGGNSYQTVGQGFMYGGILYEYDPATDVLTKKHDFQIFLPPKSGVYVPPYPAGDLLMASNGKLYGSTWYGGIFEYDPLLDTLMVTSKNPFINFSQFRYKIFNFKSAFYIFIKV